MGAVESARFRVRDPGECDTTAEAGRDVAGLLESREFDTVLEKRRSHVGCVTGVLARELSLPSGFHCVSRPMFRLRRVFSMLLLRADCTFSE